MFIIGFTLVFIVGNKGILYIGLYKAVFPYSPLTTSRGRGGDGGKAPWVGYGWLRILQIPVTLNPKPCVA